MDSKYSLVVELIEMAPMLFSVRVKVHKGGRVALPQGERQGFASVRRWAPSAGAVRKVLLTPLSVVPSRYLQKVVTAALMAQGVGWGADTPEAEVRAIASLLAPDRPTTVLDVGANVGNWAHAWLAAYPATRVVCVEPSAINARALGNRYSREPRVEIVRAAIGRHEGQALLAAPCAGSARATLFPDVTGGMIVSEEVRLMTIDRLCLELGLDSVDVLKLDVEGAELDALLGAQKTLTRTQVVQFEYGEPDLHSRVWFRDLWDLLIESGFEIQRLTPRGLRRIDRYDAALEVPRCTNFIALRGEFRRQGSEPRIGR